MDRCNAYPSMVTIATVCVGGKDMCCWHWLLRGLLAACKRILVTKKAHLQIYL